MAKLLLVIACACCSVTGCRCVTGEPDRPSARMEELLSVQDTSGPADYDWGRGRHTDQSSHLEPVHVHGGLGL